MNFERYLLYFIDIFLLVSGLYFSYLLRFDFVIPYDYLYQFYLLIPSLILVRFAMFNFYKSYDIILRFFSFSDFLFYFKPFFAGTIILIFINIFRNIYFVIFLLVILYFLDKKRDKIIIYIEQARLNKVLNFTIIIFGFLFLIIMYWLNIHFHKELIPVKEFIRTYFLNANYPSEKSIPRTIIILEFFINYFVITFVRIVYRYIIEKKKPVKHQLKKVAIFGAGKTGELVLFEILKKSSFNNIEVVGFIDDDKSKWKKKISGYIVLGGSENLEEIREKYKINEIIISISKYKGEVLENFIKKCTKLGISFRIASELEFIKNRSKFIVLREVKLEDILDRNIKEEIEPLEENIFKDKVVLITGAGGSIGSELCRQLTDYFPKKLVLVGRGENSIYNLINELSLYFPLSRIYPIIADIKDQSRMNNIFNKFKPDFVFHSAAHKHVPLMEYNPGEALKNNFLGTINLAQISDFYGVKKFIFISTDKAVNPINMMGASKKLSELYITNVYKNSHTDFIITRFGNVLGSRGSVVPLFIDQIKRGGPVTVTDKNVQRYFITIPEAVSLVLKSTEIGKNSDIFILDMGQQISILKLAENLIYLAGLKPYEDIPIVFTGLRPGEKLEEELVTQQEGVTPVSTKGLFKAQTLEIDFDILMNLKEKLDYALSIEDINTCYILVKKIIPSLKKSRNFI